MPPTQTTPYEKLQPCLFDRLIDDDPQNKKEGRMARVMSLSEYQAAVLRDLRWLLNSSCHTAAEELSDFPEVERSVFNYGIPSLSGLGVAGMNLKDLEIAVGRALRAFEPRLAGGRLVVRVSHGAAVNSPNTLFFEIRGELWARPYPEQLFIKTALDIETGALTM